MIRAPGPSASLENPEDRLRTAATLLAAALGAALAAGCSNTDNQVVGGVLGSGSVPNAVFVDVASAINGPATATDEQGNLHPVNAVILSDHPNLCDQLDKNPDYLQAPVEPFVVLVLLSPQRMVGTYYIGQTGISAALLVTAGGGQPVYTYPGVQGNLGLGQLNSNPGGSSEGSFTVYVTDGAGNLSALYGQFKTGMCPALADAFVPFF